MAHEEKKRVPWKTNFGILQLDATSVEHGKNQSETKQLYLFRSRQEGQRAWLWPVALKNFCFILEDSAMSKDPHPSGNPTSTQGNLIVRISTLLVLSNSLET
ncbi:hypothetical protein OIU76_005818 [Salix suchowensis]|uniref:Uncharacterized protein n=1 Tax=Salix suchowensis TaxID=1278906 RepID=A0ABQ9A817_9ROSI|nr:hypothetical protein OIU78_015707 [Salix suchowensis]KAJ6328618.1 hypothetical protein OIU77_010332 [Salix suchowensis]KAJ6344169.1 hypothetical protein OIU76_005818 [Salix suchowensis]